MQGNQQETEEISEKVSEYKESLIILLETQKKQ